METFFLYFNGGLYQRSDSLPGLVLADSLCGYSSKGDALIDLYECQRLLSKNTIGMSDEYVNEQRHLIDNVEVISSSDIRIAAIKDCLINTL